VESGGEEATARLAVSADKALVKAAGGIVTRERTDGGLEVLVVHRARYDVWSFPTGKLQSGESDEDGARREVEEETGYRVALADELGARRYDDRHGRPKQVRYWRMAVAGGAPNVPNDEVDELRWLAPDEAATLLSYDGDRRLLEVLGAPR
jgi:8-oxo-dGTP diphosphatase